MYPEASADEDADRTSVTSQGDMASLVNKTVTPSRGQDYVATQVASDEARAAQARANERGNPLDMDGTVEIQNPMDVWKHAQNAMAQARANNAPPDEETADEWDEDSKTEVVDPATMSFPFSAPSHAARQNPTVEAPPPLQASEAYLPTQQNPAISEEMAQRFLEEEQRMEFGPQDSSVGFDFGSGPSTPTGARQTGDSWNHSGWPDEPAQPARVAADGGFGRSPSGLTSAALFDDIGAEDEDAAFGLAPLPGTNEGLSGNSSQSLPIHEDAPAHGEHPGPWKLKTNFGLTYEFPDTRGLRSWLSSREELDGFTVSADDGASFHPLTQFPQFDRSAGRSPSTSGISRPQIPTMGAGMGPGVGADRSEPSIPSQFMEPMRPGGPTEASFNAGTGAIKGPRVNTEYRPPSRDKPRAALWLVFLVLAAAAVLIGLERFQIFKITDVVRSLGILPAAETPTTKDADVVPAPQTASQIVAVDPEALAKEQAEEIERLLADAERLAKGNKLKTALDRLKTTEQLAPQDVRVHDLKAQVHEKLGEKDLADAARAKAAELRAALGAGADAGNADGGVAPDKTE